MRKSIGRQLVLAGLLSAVVVQGATAADGPPKVTAASHATKGDDNPGRLYSGPSIAVDPENNLNVLASVADMRTRRCVILRSADGGQTWRRLDASPSLGSYPFCLQTNGSLIQAPIAFGRNSTAYVALVGWDAQDQGPRRGGSVLLGRSTDLGNTWQTTIVYDARGKDPVETNRPIAGLTVDSRSGNDDVVTVGWSRSFPDAVAPNQEPTRPLVAVSTNGGRNFGPPVDLAADVFQADALRTEYMNATTVPTTNPNATTTTVASPPGSRRAQPNQAANFGGSNPRVAAHKGKIYALWSSGTANVTPSPQSAWFLSKSTDGGRTWTSSKTTDFTGSEGNPRLAISPKDGSLHVVAGANPIPTQNSFGDVFYRRSTDEGRTWTEPKVISDDDPRLVKGQFQPYVTVAPNGRVDVAWWDTRDDPGIRGNDVYYSYSEDNGNTFSPNRRVTDRTIDRRIGVWAYNFDMSSPPGLASTNAYAVFAWDDTRNTENFNYAVGAETGGGVQDVYSAAVQFEAVGAGTSKTAKMILAGVVGLLAVGLILLAVGLAGRSKAGGDGPVMPRRTKAEKKKVTDKTQAGVG